MISALLLSVVLSAASDAGIDEAIRAVAVAAEAAAQDKAERAKKLIAEGKKAEGYALVAEILFERGNRAKAQEAYDKAKSYGWTEPPPWGEDAPAPTPTTGPRPTAGPRETPTPSQPKKPRFTTAAGARGVGGKPDSWPYFYYAPLKDGRNATWHSTLGIPAMEEAVPLPRKMWNFRTGLELQSSDFAETINGETTLYHTDRHEEVFELNYGLTDNIVVGGRITMGELLQVGDDVIRIFEGGTQIIPTGDRTFAVGELVARGKYVMMDVADMVNLGALLEIKVPLSDSAALYTSGTLDISMTGLMTIPVTVPALGEGAIHLNAGIVMPVGSSGLFEPSFDPNMFIHYGLGGALRLHERLTGIFEIEGNTPGWSDIGVLDKSILRVTTGGRWKIGQKAFMSGALGMGADEISGGLLASLTFDFTF